MGEPTRDDLLATIKDLTNALGHSRAQLRRSHDELDWAHRTDPRTQTTRLQARK